MQEQKNDKLTNEKSKTVSILSFKKYLVKLRKFFIYWLIAVVIIAFLNVGYSCVQKVFTGKVFTSVNFSFDGIESGLDPSGNKFDVSDIKSKKIIEESLEELGLKGKDVDLIISHISIDGIVPIDVIDRITQYDTVFDSVDIVSSKDIQDTSYYPTQYKIELECNKAGLSKKESADLLNKMTEKYRTSFYSAYGYNTSLEAAVTSIDYKEYDYVEAIDVFHSSLGSLQYYINELAANDNTRFQSENGYTFADISASIDTIRTEELDWISSYIMLNNVTKDKKILIANYKFKIEDLKRNKSIAEEIMKSISDTIDIYEKNSIIIFGNTMDGAKATLNQSSDTYDKLITQKIHAQTEVSSFDQNIKRYEERIKSLQKGSATKANGEIVESEFENISKKIDSLLKTANETASEYYEDVLLNNAYTVLSPASSSMFLMIKLAIKDSVRNILIFELLLTALYLTISALAIFVKSPFHVKTSNKNSDKKNKKKK